MAIELCNVYIFIHLYLLYYLCDIVDFKSLIINVLCELSDNIVLYDAHIYLHLECQLSTILNDTSM